MNTNKDKIITIEKDWEQQCITFKFPYQSAYRYLIYSMIGRMYVEIGEDRIMSYDISDDILEINFFMMWETDEKEQRQIQEILSHWTITPDAVSVFSPLNFDLTLTDFLCNPDATEPKIIKVAAGEVADYGDVVFSFLKGRS